MSRRGDVREPIRTCIGCRTSRPQTQLLRLVLDAHGEIRVDRRASGRGAWLCGPACLDRARRAKAFARAWRTSVSPEAIDRLRIHLTTD